MEGGGRRTLQEFPKIYKYIYDLEYVSIPDYNYINMKLHEAMDVSGRGGRKKLQAGKVKPEDGLDWDAENAYNPPPFKKE